MFFEALAVSPRHSPGGVTRRQALAAAAAGLAVGTVRGEGLWETTPAADEAIERGLAWLARNQGPQGNWDDGQLGLVCMGALAFMAAGHAPGRSSRYGDVVAKALDFVVRSAQPSGLLNRAQGNDMYNHGLSTFVLGQAYGMTPDPQVGRALDRALRLICDVQCGDGGWGYQAQPLAAGHDLSLVVMQAKALRSAMDSGFDVPAEVVSKAVNAVRRHYVPDGGFKPGETEDAWKERPGAFSYSVGGTGRISLAMTAAGIVCLQEFGQYDDWRIPQATITLERIVQAGDGEFDQAHVNARPKGHGKPANHVPFDSYTLYYTAQAIYQVGGATWQRIYPLIRDRLVQVQERNDNRDGNDGSWSSTVWWMQGKQALLYGTAIGCFCLAIPNRFLPILQEGRIEGLGGPAAG